MELQTKIQELADQAYDEVIGMRRHIHAHPELSFEEEKTAAYVKSQLESMGVPVKTGFAGHGLVAHITGTGTGDASRTLALRADMDALPITEANEVSYKSLNPGVMHACGHDVHTSSLLGTTRILTQVRDQFAGTIKLLFQPAEEKAPGGASLMIRDGALQNPQADAILGQHVLPYLDRGKIGIRSGIYMASADEIYIRVIGKGGHAAHPAHFIDPVMIAAQMLVTLQQVVSRSDPRVPTILSFGKVTAQGATNVIPNEVNIEGTLRTMDETWRAEAKQKILDTCHGVAAALGGKVEVNIVHGYPVLHNEETLSGKTRGHISEYVGEENVVDLDLWMAAEDFAYYTHEVPGCFYRLGTRNEEKGIVHGLHTPLFDIDEEAMRISTGLMAWLSIRELQNGK